VLASDIPAFRRVLGDGQAGALFANGDPASLAREAEALLDAPERRAKLAEEALIAVMKYDWSTVARDVVRVYETVTAGGAGRVEEDL
jgi:phosphatidylinositol alpha-mannosyltransferase